VAGAADLAAALSNIRQSMPDQREFVFS